MRKPILVIVTMLLAAPVAADQAIIDWSDWERMLRTHVHDGSVDYDGMRAEPGFAAVVETIAGASLSGHERDAKMVFLINAYNVLSIKGILDGRSPRTALGKLRFFFRDTYQVAGEMMSLNALEKKLLLPLGEPRVHFAIVCSSASCPPLRSEAYSIGRLDEQLEVNARLFLNDPTKNTFDAERGEARLSKIFKWFSEDFGRTPERVQRYIAPFVDDEVVAEGLRAGRFKIRYLPYDWSLNGTLVER